MHTLLSVSLVVCSVMLTLLVFLDLHFQSDTALERVRSLLSGNKAAVGVRIGVKTRTLAGAFYHSPKRWFAA